MESGCRALADKLEFPIYFQGRSEYKVVRETRITTPVQRSLTYLPIWQPIEKDKTDLELNLHKLPPLEPKPIVELVDMLEKIKIEKKYDFPDSKVPYLVIACVVLIVIVIIAILCIRRNVVIKALATKVLRTLTTTDKPTAREQPTKEEETHMNSSTDRLNSTVAKESHNDNAHVIEPTLTNNNGAHIEKGTLYSVVASNSAPAHDHKLGDVYLDLKDLGYASIGLGASRSLSPSARPGARTTLMMSARRARR